MESLQSRFKIARDSFGKVVSLDPKVIDLGDSPGWKPKYEYFRNDGWGYKDTRIIFDKTQDCGFVTGSRYSFSGSKYGALKKYMEKEVGFCVAEKPLLPQEKMAVDPPYINEKFLADIERNFARISFEDKERIMHSHGHTLYEVHKLKYDKFDRFVDVVVYPGKHEDVEKIVKAAVKNDVALIPYGGGTNVTKALLLTKEEKRMIVSVDMARMNHIKWVDKENMLVCVESGIIGVDLNKELKKFSVCTGHEPDSVEFSTLGGWISTRCSGMKKNAYGNIEDMVHNIKIVTPIGTFEKVNHWPRISNGPDLFQVIMGSEGLFGIITEAVLRIRPFAEVHEYDSVIFPDFENGVKFLKDIQRARATPASLRLVDNMQFRFAAAFSNTNKTFIKNLLEKVAKFYVTSIRGYDPFKISVATILYEGSASEVGRQKKAIAETAKVHKGMLAGAESGKKGYRLTFQIAYIRDFVMEQNFIAESFETSVPWTKILPLCDNVRKQIFDSAKKYGVKGDPFVTFRISIVYETGATVYVYFGFWAEGLKDVVKVYEDIEDDARSTVLASGGSLSHHHGVGKVRKQFMPQIMASCGLDILRGIKEKIDPNNIFANNNIIDVMDSTSKEGKEPLSHNKDT